MRKIFPGNEKKAGVTGDSLLSAAMTALVDEPVTARLSFNINAVVKELYKRGETKESILNKIEKYPVSKGLKRKLRESLEKTSAEG